MRIKESLQYATTERAEALLLAIRLQRASVDRFYDRLHYWLYFKPFFGSHIDLIGKADIRIHRSTQLFMHDSRIVVENGVLSIGHHPLRRSKDDSTLRLQHSTLHVLGNVELRAGVRIWAMNANVAIGNGTVINGPSGIVSKAAVEIGSHVLIAANTSIMDCDLHKHAVAGEKPQDIGEKVTIGDRCWIGNHVTILKGVVIGDGSIVAAHSLVVKDVEARTMVAGVPARKIKENIIWEP